MFVRRRINNELSANFEILMIRDSLTVTQHEDVDTGTSFVVGSDISIIHEIEDNMQNNT